MYRNVCKRLFDLALVVPGLVILAPVMGLIAVAVASKVGWPVFFFQRRPGLGGRPFVLLKFRTMTEEADGEGKLLPDEERLTRLGRFLRRTSLDELPELINVLKGEMSLVGPRPLLMRYLPYYSPRERRRMEVLPGITGWAQIQGRNEVPWDERLELDVWYVEHLSFLLDLRILATTVIRVIRREGVHLAPATKMMDLDVERAKEMR